MIAEFAAISVTMYAAHNLADHVLGQSDYQAANKTTSWKAMTGHVFDYHLVMIAMLTVVCMVFNIPVTFLGVFAALLFSVVSHAFIDRRWPIKWLLSHIGSSNFANMQTPINGMYQADQALHYFCLWISAMLFVSL